MPTASMNNNDVQQRLSRTTVSTPKHRDVATLEAITYQASRQLSTTTPTVDIHFRFNKHLIIFIFYNSSIDSHDFFLISETCLTSHKLLQRLKLASWRSSRLFAGTQSLHVSHCCTLCLSEFCVHFYAIVQATNALAST